MTRVGLTPAGLAVLSQLYGESQPYTEALQRVRALASRVSPQGFLAELEDAFPGKTIRELTEDELTRFARILEERL